MVDTHSKIINGTESDKYFPRLTHSLINIDEFVNFKKFFVTSLN